MPETYTVTLDDLEGIADWGKQNVSPADQARINAISEACGKDKQQQFANQPTLWEIDWFHRDSVKQVYRLALVNSETQVELWGYC